METIGEKQNKIWNIKFFKRIKQVSSSIEYYVKVYGWDEGGNELLR